MRTHWALVFLLFLISLLLAACGSNYNKTYSYTVTSSAVQTLKIKNVYVDCYFSDAEKKEIDLSIHDWNHCLNKQIVFNIVDYNFDMEPIIIKKALESDGLLILKLPGNSVLIPSNSEKNRLTLAWADKIGGNIIYVVPERLASYQLHNALLHEIGHILNLQHVKNTKSLMFAHFETNNYPCIDRESIILIADYYLLDKNKVNYCIID